MTNNNQNGLVGLRVIATFCIATFHFELSYQFITGTQIFSTSYLFVEFFFILSGFLFAKGIIDGRHHDDTLSMVIKDKILRLYPAYLAGLLLLPCVYSLVWYGGDYFGWITDGNLKSFIVELLMLQATGLSNFHYINNPSWYVSALFLSTILVFLFIKRIRKKYFYLLISIISYVSIWTLESFGMSTTKFVLLFIPVPLVRGIAGVFLGVFCYYLYQQYHQKIAEISFSILTILEIMLFGFLMYLVLLRESDWQNALFIIPSSLLIIIMFSTNKGLVSKILSHKWWIFFSNISYSFYITQSFCSNVFTCMLPNVELPLVYIWYLILNLIVAICIYYLVEKPITKMKRSKKTSN